MSNNERFDIVDENNHQLGFTKDRVDVHSLMKDWHRATHIWIINNKGEILCQQRSLIKDVHPGKWQSFFGGHLKAGQTYGENAIEELKEELGLRVNIDELVPLYILKNDPAKHFGQVYIFLLNRDIDDFLFKDNEVAQVRWFSQDEVHGRMIKGDFCNRFDPVVQKEIINRISHAKRD